MDAEELYLKSCEAMGGNMGEYKIQGLDVRIFNILWRNGFTNSEKILNIEKVYSAVLDGSIWAVRQLGKKSVKKICEWLVEKKGL